MNRLRLLRVGALDLISAAAFLAIWLLRDRFEYDTLRSLLLWPVVFEMYLSFTLFLAGLLYNVRRAAGRWIWFALFILAYLFAAWLTGENSYMPQAWTIAFWLLIARIWPPRTLAFGSRPYLEWLQRGAGISFMLWGAGFVAMMMLVLFVPGHTETLADGTQRSASPAWIFPLVWTPYFIAEAIHRAWRDTRLEEENAKRAASKH
ncbi:hypothetical protein [Dokdonella sp.]|uniref:hypothetical protein n=1 Tax=Dokdonella sp. TaxID=2291710 RepID=UPI00352923D9